MANPCERSSSLHHCHKYYLSHPLNFAPSFTCCKAIVLHCPSLGWKGMVLDILTTDILCRPCSKTAVQLAVVAQCSRSGCAVLPQWSRSGSAVLPQWLRSANAAPQCNGHDRAEPQCSGSAAAGRDRAAGRDNSDISHTRPTDFDREVD